MLKEGKYISAKTIVEKVFMKYDYAEQYVSYSDCIEYIWEVISLINIPMNYVSRYCEIDISDYRGNLPSDFESVDQIRDKNTLLPLLPTTDLFYNSENKVATSTQNTFVNIEGEPVYLQTEQNETTCANYNHYKIDNGYIYTEEKDRVVELAYQAFPIDNEGFPRILEDPKLIRALESYIVYVIDRKAWRRGEVADKVYKDSEQEYHFAVGAVQTQAVMPDLNMMESIRRRRSLIVQDTNNFDKSFKYLGG